MGPGDACLVEKRSKRSLDWTQVKYQLKKADVELISAGLDEAPGAYKDIRSVMAAQDDLVEIMGQFQPSLVKMDADKRAKRKEKRLEERAKEKKKGRNKRR